jgi:hypothetical protein
VTERTSRPGEEYAGAAQEPGSGAVAKYTPKGYSPRPLSGNRRTETDDFLAELEAIFAQGQRNGQANDTNGEATTLNPRANQTLPIMILARKTTLLLRVDSSGSKTPTSVSASPGTTCTNSSTPRVSVG